jgi:hypothetical protein
VTEPNGDQSLPVSLTMPERDVRYLTIKPMLKEGKIQMFKDIFLFQKKTIVGNDIGKRSPRFDYLIGHPEKFTIEEAMMIAKLCNLEFEEIMQLIKTQIDARKKKPIKSKKESPET